MSSGTRHGILSQQKAPLAESFTVYFESNEGTSVSPVTVNYGQTLAEPTPPTKEGYLLAGWSKYSDLSSLWNFSSDTVLSNLVLYASWGLAVTVTFVENGGSTVSDQTIASGGYATNPGSITRSGFDFGGWFTDDGTFENEFDFINTQVTENITLYAKWTEIQDVRGEAVYSSPGIYTWTCPANVTSVAINAVGAGGGGARNTARSSYAQGGTGGMAYKNNVSVTPGNEYTLLVGAGGFGYYGSGAGVAQSGEPTYILNGGPGSAQILEGGGGGGASAPQLNGGGVGGGAGGYTGDGGVTGTAGSAGLLGQNTASPNVYGDNWGASWGYGGRSNGTSGTANSGTGGFLRIVWGNGRAFPSTDIELTV